MNTCVTIATNTSHDNKHFDSRDLPNTISPVEVQNALTVADIGPSLTKSKPTTNEKRKLHAHVH